MTLNRKQTSTHMQKPQKKPDAAAAFQHILALPSSIAAQAAMKEKRSYKCAHCSTTFRRSEHCIRHERSHTLEKPFGCGVCGCNFSRKDLLVRHERTVHSTSRNASARPAKRQRTSSEAGIESKCPTVHAPEICETQDIQSEYQGTFNSNNFYTGLSPAGSSPASVYQFAPTPTSPYGGAQPMTPPSDTPNHPYRRESLSQHTAATPENIDHRHHHHSIHQQMDEIREDTRRPDESQNESDFFEFFPHLSTGAESSYGQGLPEMNPPIGSQFDGFHVDLDHLTNNPPGPSIADLFKDSAMTPTMVEFGAPQVDLTALPNSWGSDSAGVYESIRTRLQDTEFELSTGGQARLTPAAVGMWADFMADTLMWATKLHGGPSYAKQES